MLTLPPGCAADDLERLADWVEASTLLDAQGTPKSQIMEELQSSALVSASDAAFGEDDDELEIGEDESYSEALERLADDILAECRSRAVRYGLGYPFSLGTDRIEITRYAMVDSYAFLLVADLGHHYPQLKDALTPDTHSGQLMEKVVEASAKGLFGKSRRFGWPKEPSWPTGIDDRVRKLATELDVPVDALEGKTDPADNDRTLDVVGMWNLGGSYDASLTILVQCAAGQNWKTKLGDPSTTAWNNLLIWGSPIVRAIALPWRLGGRRGDWGYRRIYSLSNGAMVLDRPRLLDGSPDLHLDPEIRGAIEAWWRNAIDAIPLSTVS